ncbi:MAG: hypothetical protein IMZ58_07625 [Thermoplasmata archaeon]|nr:hypothetical protein [Thermoplasmata archaeon]
MENQPKNEKGKITIVFALVLIVFISCFTNAILGIICFQNYQSEHQIPNQYILPFMELEEYLRLCDEKYNTNYRLILNNFGDDEVTVEKSFMENVNAVTYHVHHFEELVVDIGDGNKYETTKFYIVPEQISFENNTYPLISFYTKFENHDAWILQCFPIGKQISIVLKEV